MDQETDYEFEERDVSKNFTTQVPELTEIGQKFPIDCLESEILRRDLDSEFELLRAMTETRKHQQGLQLCEGMESRKNRYPEQSIYSHSRVRLCGAEYNGADYINANLVFRERMKGRGNGVTIISQGPLQATTPDFNHMIHMHGITCVIKLCQTVENGKPRCFDYLNSQTWAQVGDKMSLKEMEVTVSHINGVFRPVTHLDFPNWPDKSVPEDPSQLDELIQSAKTHSNVLIHCSAGLGRSGVVACILEQIRREEEMRDGIGIFQTARRLRQARFRAVQNSQQYRFIYQYLLHYYGECCEA